MPEAIGSPLGRSIWSGSISFGLVTVPVELYSAWRRGGLALRLLGPSGWPLRRELVCPAERKAVSGDEIERGVEVRDGELVSVTEQELEQIAPGRSREIALERFVPRDAIDPAYFVRSYLLLPAGEQPKAYTLLADAMESAGRAAIARFVMRGRSHAVAIFADRGVLRAEILRFGDEVREPGDVGLPEPPEVDRATLRLMAARVERLQAAKLDEAELADEHAARLVELARRKRERGVDLVELPHEVALEEPDAQKIVDLMVVLKERLRSQLQDTPPQPSSHPSSKPSTTRRRATREV